MRLWHGCERNAAGRAADHRQLFQRSADAASRRCVPARHRLAQASAGGSLTMQWEVVIGLETHVQLSTQSKIFSGAATRFGAEPNTQACALDLALPGTLPVVNRGAVERAIRFGLAIGAAIAPRSVFARKNYFYPDLPKGYQISQYELPVVQGGSITIQVEANEKAGRDAYEKTIRLTRAHLEEDAGKSLHEDFAGMTGIDLNRAGTPLLEIVTEPDMRSAAEAVAYAKALHSLVVWLGICDGNMQEGSFRCDANVSVRRLGEQALGTRAEIKNLNSFRFLEEAIQYEVRRQIELIEDGGTVVQETRLYDPDRGETRSMRSKEDAHDYRYFPDPDLMPLVIDSEWIAEVGRALPELPDAMKRRFTEQYGLPGYDAGMLTTSQALAAYYEQVVSKAGVANAKMAANWVMGELASQLNRDGLDIAQSPVSAAQLALVLVRIADGTISNKIGKAIFGAIWDEKATDDTAADRIIDAKGLRQISDSGALEAILDEVLAANPKSVDEYRAGKDKAFNALVGQAMKATKGRANPQQVNELLKKKLS
ncbi:Aspartyl/glutamyl-tRNA(Asn/Gln) amidotransferase subunit B (EC 6.3.5.-) [Mycetohabitans rhizoxinica HKI 454]|uniref:Aspartyl/glutamyl-tRNA(Asn/Gln) amidotransferase subunit B n=2 Tax=Burkholderiaceae TaxID=119060 RepID=E5ANA1_MYCRK|nr:Aspartyl/glutamyl-tRNA(Asn/Gln) amidotransferase subunit B (EC 6.3.5.-) [Mycetohabitans rhizoxinica HKI 454]